MIFAFIIELLPPPTMQNHKFFYNLKVEYDEHETIRTFYKN